MICFVILTFLLSSCSAQVVTLVASSPAIPIISPPSLVTGIDSFHSANPSSPQIAGANWIWENSTISSWPNGMTLLFEATFTAVCLRPAILRIAADNTFSASVLDTSGTVTTGPMQGSQWSTLSSFDVGRLQCGVNKLQVKVTNLHSGSPAGVIFALTQDQSSCFKCKAYQFYNKQTCRCECNPIRCPFNMVFNPRTCSCQCLPVSCKQGYLLNPKTCLCEPICEGIYCIYPFVLNADCKCECPAIKCQQGFTLDSTTCECKKNCKDIVCSKPKIIDDCCECSCPRIEECPFGTYWDNNVCSCLKQCDALIKTVEVSKQTQKEEYESNDQIQISICSNYQYQLISPLNQKYVKIISSITTIEVFNDRYEDQLIFLKMIILLYHLSSLILPLKRQQQYYKYYGIDKNSLKMIKTTVFAILCLLSLQQNVLIASQPSNTIAVTGQAIVLEAYHTANQPNYLGNIVGAQWIWKAGGPWADGDTLSFVAYFYADCIFAGQLRITADNVFSATINGGSAMTGSDWTKVYSFKLNNLLCGSNKLQVKVINKNQYSVAALIFAVVQYQNGCYECLSPISFYNHSSCKCECIGGCDCSFPNKPWQWVDYPTCGCICKHISECNELSYWNKKTCQCQCKPKTCLPGQLQNPKTCECLKWCAQNVMCTIGKIWNSNQCKCVCEKIVVCPPPLSFNESNCRCSRYCIPAVCPIGLTWSNQLCKCFCDTTLIKVSCISPSVWSNGICACCLPKNCGIIGRFDSNMCSCVPYYTATTKVIAEVATETDAMVTPSRVSADLIVIGCIPMNCAQREVWNTQSCACQSTVKIPPV